MNFVFSAIAPVFMVIALGFGLRKSGAFPPENWRVVEDLCFWVLFPAILIKTLAYAELDAIGYGAFSFSLVLSIIIMSGLMLASWPAFRTLLKTERSQFSTIFQTTTRWHGFIALAIVINLYGQDGAALIAIAFSIMVPILQITNLLVLASFSSASRPNITHILLMIIKNPILWGVAIGLAINLSGVNLSPPIIDFIDLVGRAALGISLLALGAGLSLAAALRPSRELVFGLVSKLILNPIIAVICGLLLNVGKLELSVLLICTAVPTAMNGYVLARKMGGDAPLYASIATLQTIFSFITIPIGIWVVRTYFEAA